MISRLRTALAGLPLAAALSLAPAPGISQQPLRSLAEPSLSLDASEIAFVSGGDVWAVGATGGDARLLVAHPADESRPLWSPDGRRLAFVSDRAGDADVYVLDLESGVVRRLTFADAPEELNAWSRDGRWIYFSSGSLDVGGTADVFRVRSGGGTPMLVSADSYAEEFSAAPSPDGERLVVAGRGRQAQAQWWRNGHSHIDESELWLVRPGDRPAYSLLTAGGKNLWPGWAEGGRSVVFMSDRSGAENLWQVAVGAEGPAGEPWALTRFSEGRVLFPSVSADGRKVAFERDFGIWTLDLPAGEPRPLPVTLRGAIQEAAIQHVSLDTGFSSFALSPDGKKVAFVARGEVFAASSEDGGDAARVTRSVEAESNLRWAPDSRRLAYVSRRDGRPSIWLHDFGSGEERRITSGGDDATPVFSPDGKTLAYVRGGTDLRLANLEDGSGRSLAAGRFWRPPYSGALEWSGDGRWLAWLAADDEGFTNVHVVGSEGGAPQLVSGLPNSFGETLVWDPDGRSLYFWSGHRTEDGRIARVDLVPRTPVFREDRFRELFETPPTAGGDGDGGLSQASTDDDEPDPVVIEFDGIRRRLELLPVGVDVGEFTLSPDGKTLVFTAIAEGQTNLYAYSVDEEAEEPPVTRQLTSTPGAKSSPAFSQDGTTVFYLDRGRIAAVTVADSRTRTLSIRAELDVSFDQGKVAAFEEAWTHLSNHFYDDALHGADWEGARRAFAPRIAGASSQGELRRLMNLMIGELNGSHLGYTVPAPTGGPSEATASLGLRFERAAYEEEGVFRISAVVPLGPADVVEGIQAGDALLAVDGRTLDNDTSLDQLMVSRAGERVVLTVADEPDGAGRREVAVQPMSLATERELIYREWVDGRRAYVDRASGGRLGYVHMFDMSDVALLRLVRDLDAENHGKEGVVVDIRNNNGGFVHAYALDVFARRGFLTFERRGLAHVNARSQLGQRSLEVPTVLVVNHNTLSDGEDFTEGYRSLGLGPVVGEPTAGWIIFTGSLSLVNGGSIRMPAVKVRGADGAVMELNPRPVDVLVERPVGESYSGRDSQLDEAVRVLLGQIDQTRLGQGGR
jgi:Tol biopolymer transport system component